MNRLNLFKKTAAFTLALAFLMLNLWMVSAGTSYTGKLQISSGRGYLTISGPGKATTPFCGDGITQTYLGEDCDGSSLNGATCTSLWGSDYTGTVTCSSGCLYVSSCTKTTTTPSTDTSGGSSGGGGGSSSSSSSGGGGGSSAKTCIENWECSNWTEECFTKPGSEEEIQSRTCSDINKCGKNSLKPIEERACNIEITSTSKPGILGAIIGGGSTLGKLVIGFIVVVIIVLLIILLGRKSK